MAKVRLFRGLEKWKNGEVLISATRAVRDPLFLLLSKLGSNVNMSLESHT